MELSKNNSAVKKAYEKGYSVDDRGIVTNKDGEEIKQTKDSRGYLKFNIQFHGKAYPVWVHKLMAYQKFGDKLFQDGIETRHLNGDKLNNTPENVTMGSHSDNMMDQPKCLRIRKAKQANELVSDEEALEIKERVKNRDYETYRDLAKEYGLKSKSSIHYILNDKKILNETEAN